MLVPKTRWVVRNGEKEKVEQITDELHITPLVSTLLINRGIQTVEDAKSFLYPTEGLYDPFLLTDMDLCVQRINEAINNNERIVIYGDYDADGVCSTVVLYKALEQLGANVDYYIPNRFTEGYGPNEGAFRKLKDAGFQLIITVDNGIAGIREAQIAKEIGIDLIITDHHEPGPELPEAIAVIHPKRKHSNYPFKELAGVGVAFKVATALLGHHPYDLLQFVAIGTIADLVPLKGENRFIVKQGLSLLRATKHVGLLKLIQVVNIDKESITEESIGFGLAPRINAPGRLNEAGIAVQLFLTEDEEVAEQLAMEIDDLNKERQEIVTAIEQEATEEYIQSMDKNQHTIVVGKAGWHPGVIGIVASRLVEKFYRPVIILSYDFETGLAKGSARSIPGFHLYNNLSRCKDILPHFGGHPMAAGMTLKIDDVDTLRGLLNQFASEQLDKDDFIPVSEIDGVFTIDEITLDALEQIQLLAPFGADNPKPKILIKDIHLPNLRKVGADQKHLKFTLSDGMMSLDGIAFGMGEFADHISPLSKTSVVGEISVNEWNNIRKPQLLLKDIAINEWQLFDYRGNKKIEQWIDNVPKENRVFIIFNEITYERMNLSSIKDEVKFIASMENTLDCQLNDKNVIFLDMPPTKEWMESLLKGQKLSRIYAHFYQEKTQFLSMMPTRDHFKWYYAFLFKKGVFDLSRYGNDLAKFRGWTTNTIKFMTRVFLDLNFVTMSNGIVSINKNADKKDLTDSKTYQEWQSHIQLEKEILFSSYQQLKEWFDECIGVSNHEEEIIWT